MKFRRETGSSISTTGLPGFTFYSTMSDTVGVR